MFKVIAAILMLIDHMGMVFFEDNFMLRIIGRLSMPLFAYCVAKGFDKTSSFKKYLIRMGLFAGISQIPFWMMQYVTDSAHFQFMHFNIGFTFFGALITLYLYRGIKANTCQNKIVNLGCILTVLTLSTVLECDYGAYAILLVLVFYEYYIVQENVVLTFIMFLMATMILFVMGKGNQFIVQLFALPALLMIVGIKDKPIKGFKYFFYIFYPAHMIILSLLKWMQ